MQSAVRRIVVYVPRMSVSYDKFTIVHVRDSHLNEIFAILNFGFWRISRVKA